MSGYWGRRGEKIGGFWKVEWRTQRWVCLKQRESLQYFTLDTGALTDTACRESYHNTKNVSFTLLNVFDRANAYLCKCARCSRKVNFLSKKKIETVYMKYRKSSTVWWRWTVKTVIGYYLQELHVPPPHIAWVGCPFQEWPQWWSDPPSNYTGHFRSCLVGFGRWQHIWESLPWSAATGPWLLSLSMAWARFTLTIVQRGLRGHSSQRHVL